MVVVLVGVVVVAVAVEVVVVVVGVVVVAVTGAGAVVESLIADLYTASCTKVVGSFFGGTEQYSGPQSWFVAEETLRGQGTSE